MGLSGVVWDQACEGVLCFFICEMGITTAPYSWCASWMLGCMQLAHNSIFIHFYLFFMYKMPVIVAPTLLEDEMNL